MGSGGIISASAVVLAGAWLVVVMAPKLAPHVGVPQFWGGRFCEKMEPLPGTSTVMMIRWKGGKMESSHMRRVHFCVAVKVSV